MKKLTHKYVKEKFEEKGWKLLSKDYKNNCTLLEVICDKGHKGLKRFNDFRNDKGRYQEIICIKK